MQTEYVRRSAGILTLEQFASAEESGKIPEISVDDALAAYARMLERPEFIEWLPWASERSDAIRDYSRWQRSAEDLQSRIRASLGIEPAASGGATPP